MGLGAALSRPWLDEYLRALPGATLDYKREWGFTHYRVGGRIFAVRCAPDARYERHHGHELVTLRCDARLIPGLLSREGVFPGFYADARYWISIWLDSPMPDEELRALCAHSYEEALSRMSKRARGAISNPD